MLSAVSTPTSARQALRAAGARQQAELDLGQRELAPRRGHAVVAAQRELQPAAQAVPVDRGDDRLRARLDGRDHVVQVGLGELAGVPNSLMSAPPEKALRPAITIALTPASAIAVSTPAVRSRRVWWPRPLTGGFASG